MKEASRKTKKVNLGTGYKYQSFCADDMVTMTEKEDLQFNVNVLNGTLSNINIKIKVRKTKSIHNCKW